MVQTKKSRLKMVQQRVAVSGSMVQEKTLEYTNGTKDFVASDGWLNCFKKRFL